MKRISLALINPLFDLIKIFSIFAAITYVAIQTMEIFQRREVLHLTIFTLLFLFASFELSISTYFERIGLKENSFRIFTTSLIMFCAGFFELVDVAIDHGLSDLKSYNINLFNTSGSIIEYLISISAIILAMTSLERFRLTIRSWVSVFSQKID